MDTIEIITYLLCGLLIIDIVISLIKMIKVHKFLKLIEHGEVSYIQAVKEFGRLYGITEDTEKTTQRRGKVVPWSERKKQ